jgi:hypothetical protein
MPDLDPWQADQVVALSDKARAGFREIVIGERGQRLEL